MSLTVLTAGITSSYLRLPYWQDLFGAALLMDWQIRSQKDIRCDISRSLVLYLLRRIRVRQNMDKNGMIECLYCTVKIKPGRASTHLLKCPAYRSTLLKLQRRVDTHPQGYRFGLGFYDYTRKQVSNTCFFFTNKRHWRRIRRRPNGSAKDFRFFDFHQIFL